jgi:bifunctional UDP-N-acetylglucosamine pyrophosphorylase/glucosamine-1-phosphate N-acetyltransferase
MKTIDFATLTIINDQELFRELFDCNSIFLGEMSSVTFSGQISLGANLKFTGKSIFNSGCIIDDGSIISNSIFGNNCHIRPYSLISGTQSGDGNIFGPFTFVRDNTFIENNSIMGAHTEIVRSEISSNVKISHRAFIADAKISENVIIGAGVIFCNFNGEKKYKSTISKSVTIGSGSLIISPVVIGESSIIAAGSVVNKDIKANKKFIQKRESVEI